MDGGRFGVRERFTYVRNLLSKIYVVSEESRPWTNLIIRPQKFTSQKPNVATSLIPPPQSYLSEGRCG